MINQKSCPENLWTDVTVNTIGKQLELIIDNILVNTPMVNLRIEGGMSSLNRGGYNKDELDAFVKKKKNDRLIKKKVVKNTIEN